MMTQTILGISAATRSVGLVVVKKGEVLDWQIKSFKQIWSKEKLEMILRSIDKVIHQHNISIVAIKSPCEVQFSENLLLLVQTFESLIKQKGIKVYRYNHHQLKHASPAGTMRNKHSLMKHIAEQYPYMQSLHEKELKNRNPYHLKVFEALLVVHHCINQSK